MTTGKKLRLEKMQELNRGFSGEENAGCVEYIGIDQSARTGGEDPFSVWCGVFQRSACHIEQFRSRMPVPGNRGINVLIQFRAGSDVRKVR